MTTSSPHTPPSMSKGIILAGGLGSRLYPMTQTISKQLLPVFGKPMVYYALCTLMQSEIRDILLITTPHDAPLFRRLLGDGSQWGVCLSYAKQAQAGGIAQAFIIAENFMANQAVTLILGDNIFMGADLSPLLVQAHKREQATIFALAVDDAKRYGVVQFDAQQQPIRIIEKPTVPPSNFAVTGLYHYPASVVQMAKDLVPSARGELEISDINQRYLAQKQLNVQVLANGFIWLDMGTPNSLSEAGQIVQAIEQRDGVKIACPEQVAYQQGFIDAEQLLCIVKAMPRGDYQTYLLNYLNSLSMISSSREG